MRVIGTAGHVDHGKSTLIQALTGTHPDRLKEEQAREMTIDLGFAWWTLPDGEEVGVVDVPGHRDFIENMLAGIGGIDAVVFVVAADEGVMPQTREHLAILDLLKIPAGVVALTKTDMVDDADWLDLVEEELYTVLSGTVLADAPLVRVSAKAGTGLEDLEAALQQVLQTQPRRPDLARPRLPIDRVFTMDGFGTVVTGTLLDGALHVGDEVEVQPAGLKGRIRGIQSHKQKVEYSQPGSRTAVNISGVDVHAVSRGNVLGLPGTMLPTRRIDVAFRLLADVSAPLAHDTEVKLFVGAAEVVARARVLGVEQLNPGEEGWLQLDLREPIVTQRNDRYILRRPSPGETLGGGVVLDAQPKWRHKRFAESVLTRMAALAEGSPAELVVQAISGAGVLRVAELEEAAHLEEDVFQGALAELIEAGDILLQAEKIKAKAWVAYKPYWERLQGNAVDTVVAYQAAEPLRPGMPRSELKSKLSLDQIVFDLLIAGLTVQERLEESGPLVHVPGYKIIFSSEQQKQIDALLAQFGSGGYSPPTIKQCIEAVTEPVYQALVAQGDLLSLSADVAFSPDQYQRAVADVRKLAGQGGITLGQMRDYWQTSRRYVQALLEYMDQQGITHRDGDVRVLK